MNFLEKFHHIDTFILDVDGVLTNGDLLIQPDGQFLRKMNVKDGFAIKHALNQGYKIAVISGGKPLGVETRLRNLGVESLFFNIQDKRSCYLEYVAQQHLDHAGIIYMGDDLPDYEVMRLVGIPACPNDAAKEIADIAQYISPYTGGNGCVRDIIEKVLRLHGRWMP